MIVKYVDKPVIGYQRIILLDARGHFFIAAFRGHYKYIPWMAQGTVGYSVLFVQFAFVADY